MNQNLANFRLPTTASDNGCKFTTNTLSDLRNENHRLKYAVAEIKLENDLKNLARKIGAHSPRAHRWSRNSDGVLEIPSLASLKWNVAALRFEIALFGIVSGERKAGFNEDEPCEPAGEPDGGEWTDGGADGGDSKPADSQAGDGGRPVINIYAHPSGDGSDGSSGGSGATDEPPLGDPPNIPE
jgi:hypothetical protein